MSQLGHGRMLGSPIAALATLAGYLVGDSLLVSHLSDQRPPAWAVALHIAGLIPFLSVVSRWLVPLIPSGPRSIRLAMHGAIVIAALVSLAALAGTERPTLPIDSLTGTDAALSYAAARVPYEFGWNHVYDAAAYAHTLKENGIPSWDPHLPGGTGAFSLLIAMNVPFAALPFAIGARLWIVAQALTLIPACMVLWAGDGRDRRAQIALMVLMPAVVFGIVLGNALVVVFSAVALAWWCCRQDKQMLAAACLTFILVKPQLAFLLPVGLAVSGRWKVLAYLAAIWAAIALVTIWLVTWAQFVMFTRNILGIAGHVAGWSVPPMTLDSVLPSALALPLRIAVAVILLIRVYRERDLEQTFALGILASMVTTPYVHIQDLSMLLLAGWILVRGITVAEERAAMLLSWLIIACASVLLPPLAFAVELVWFSWLAGLRDLALPRLSQPAQRPIQLTKAPTPE